MPTPPDREPAREPPSLSLPVRAWRLVRRWHPTVRIGAAAFALWLIGAWHVAVIPFPALTRLDLALDDMRQSYALAPVSAPRE